MEKNTTVLNDAEPGKDISALKMRRFVRHLSAATKKAEEKSQQKHEIRTRIEKIKQLSLNKRTTKDQIETELTDFEKMVREVIKDEEKILEEQRKGTKQINELKSMVEMLSKKLIALGGDYAEELDAKDRKILELREALASAHIKLSDSGETRAEKIKKIEERVRAKAEEPETEELPEQISHEELHEHLKQLEKIHTQLKKSGKHPKKKLDQLKKKIDEHKQTLQSRQK